VPKKDINAEDQARKDYDESPLPCLCRGGERAILRSLTKMRGRVPTVPPPRANMFSFGDTFHFKIIRSFCRRFQPLLSVHVEEFLLYPLL